MRSDPRPWTGRGERSHEDHPERRTYRGRPRRVDSGTTFNAAIRHRAKIQSATVARLSAGRDVVRDETPARSPRAKIQSATAPRVGAGRDATRGETPAPTTGAQITSSTTPRLAAGRDAPNRQDARPATGSPNPKLHRATR